MGGGFALSRGDMHGGGGSNSGAPGRLIPSSFSENGADTNIPFGAKVPLLRLPLRAGATAYFAGCRATITECAASGLRCLLSLEITTPSSALRPWVRANGPNGKTGVELYIRYADGTWAPQVDHGTYSMNSSLPGFAAEKYSLGGSFSSPLILPENNKTWEQLQEGSELVVCVPALHGTAERVRAEWPAAPSHRRTWNPDAPAPPSTPAAERVQRAVDYLRNHGSSGEQVAWKELEAAGAEAVAHVLKHNWGDYWMKDIVSPFLVKFAAAEHLPELLASLENDPRLADAIIDKGWITQAMPVLRRHLANGLPLTVKSLIVLATLRDVSLAPAMFSAAERTWQPGDTLAAALRNHPGIDWPLLAAAGWRRQNPHFTGYEEFPRLNPWAQAAAATGHREAWREIAAFWCITPPRPEDIPSLLSPLAWSGEMKDLPAWLRTNFDHLEWNADVGLWTVP